MATNFRFFGRAESCEFIEARLNKRTRNLAGTISAEIEEDDGVVVPDQAARGGRFSRGGFCGDDRGYDEFVSDALLITGPNCRNWIAEFCFRIAVHHRAIRFLDALPAIVAIHGVVTADNACNLSHAVLAHLLLELPQKIDAAVGRRIAPIHKTVDKNALNFILASHPQQRKKMLDMRVDTAVTYKSNEVKLPLAAALHRVEKQRLARKLAARDKRFDARDVHVNDAPRTHIQMAHLAIAHLAFRQTDKWSGSMNQCVGKLRNEAVVIWFPRESNGISLRFGSETPAVEYRENDWFRSFSHVRGGRLARERMNARGVAEPTDISSCLRRVVAIRLSQPEEVRQNRSMSLGVPG